MIQKIGIVGLGLIGGSLAKALHHRLGIAEIVAFNPSENELKSAFQEGVISSYSTEINSQFADCDIIFICIPISLIPTYAKKLLPYLKKGAILSDVGSVKGVLHDKLKDLPSDIFYIGGHPMTGSEKSCYHASKDYLFENAYYVYSPSTFVPKDKVETFRQLILGIGAIPIYIPPAQHDHAVAVISHAPHVLAACLVTLCSRLDGPEQYMHHLAAGGFKDITRIASSSPDMWTSICQENQSEILSILDALQCELRAAQTLIKEGDSVSLHHFFSQAKQYRDSFQQLPSNAYIKQYDIAVDVIDKPGSIREIASLFADNAINIQNINILNNREQEGGVLYISFYTQKEQLKSIQLLQNANFTVSIHN